MATSDRCSVSWGLRQVLDAFDEQLGESLLRYRLERLPAAQHRARQYGAEGAMFPVRRTPFTVNHLTPSSITARARTAAGIAVPGSVWKLCVSVFSVDLDAERLRHDARGDELDLHRRG